MIDIYDLAFYGSPILLLIACLLILWLVWANQGLRAVIADVEARSQQMYEIGVIHGRHEATEQYKASRPWQDGYEAGYKRACYDQAAGACELEELRKSGELTSL